MKLKMEVYLTKKKNKYYLTDVKDVKTTYDSKIYKYHIPEKSDFLVERIEKMEPQIKSALLGEGLPFEQTNNTLALALKGLSNTLKDAKGRWILTNHEDSHSEYPLTQLSENRFTRNIIDRTFVENGIRWIIDYKTGRHEGENLANFIENEVTRYGPQLNRYEYLLKEYGEIHPIKKALYFPMLQIWKEI